MSKDPELIARVNALGLISWDQRPDAFDATIHKQNTDLAPVLNSTADDAQH